MESTIAEAPDERLRDVAVDVIDGYHHESTLIYLHGFQRYGCEYLNEGRLAFCMPWVDGSDRAPGLRAVLPTAENMDQPWCAKTTSWYKYSQPWHNGVGDKATIKYTRRRLRAILDAEIARVGGDGRRVFLGGSSQGCTAALDTYLREASRLGLGGFIGNTGFIPSDNKGFFGADQALEDLIADPEQNYRPMWMQCAIDDRKDVPWRSVVEPSLKRAEGRLPGLDYRGVSGRGHGIEEWEGHYINDFLRKHAPAAYSRDRRRPV